MPKTKIENGFYPIFLKDIRRFMGYCQTQGYGNKDTCKYVAENIIEGLMINSPQLPIKEELYSDLICIVHDINNGKRFNGQQLLIPIA